jgi:hypothetical protein
MGEGIDVSSGLAGAWRLMTGRTDGLRMLDLSADGFWNSFFAILVALPALALGWLSIANDLSDLELVPFSRISTMGRLAMVDFSAWVLPLVVLALVARQAGLADRFVHYVVASNWGSAIVVWMMLPQAIVRLMLPGQEDFAAVLSLGLFAITMVLTWRLTVTVLAKGPAVGSAVFAGMFTASVATLFALQWLLGLA